MLKKTFLIVSLCSIVFNSTYAFTVDKNTTLNTRDNSEASILPEYIIILILIACTKEIVVDVSFNETVVSPTQLKLYDGNGILLETRDVRNGDQKVIFQGNFSGAFKIDVLTKGEVVSSERGWVRSDNCNN